LCLQVFQHLKLHKTFSYKFLFKTRCWRYAVCASFCAILSNSAQTSAMRPEIAIRPACDRPIPGSTSRVIFKLSADFAVGHGLPLPREQQPAPPFVVSRESAALPPESSGEGWHLLAEWA
jgi:hypothetical protein